jgi:hypothetical protein
MWQCNITTWNKLFGVCGSGGGGGDHSAGGGGTMVKDSWKNRTLNPIHKEYRNSLYFNINFSVSMEPYRKIIFES